MLLKGKILVIISSLFIIGQLNAQDDKFSIGPRVGVNFANVSNVEGDTKSLTGLAIGLTSTYSINETAGLTFDLLYSGEGYKLGDDALKLSYIQIPIYFDVFLGEQGENFRPKVYAGFVPGFLLHAKANDTELDKDQFSGFNFAFSGGLGFNLRVTDRVWLNTDLRAYLGLTDIRDEAFQVGDKQANNNVQLSLGLAYGLSKI